MREIKFRAWDKNRKEMIVVEEIHFKYNSIVYDDGIITSPMKNFEVMQFIGLGDKNGKEIYEGDIVKYGSLNRLGEIVFFECRFIILDIIFDMEKRLHIFEDADPDTMSEVIGNIYENPELLKEESKSKD